VYRISVSTKRQPLNVPTDVTTFFVKASSYVELTVGGEEDLRYTEKPIVGKSTGGFSAFFSTVLSYLGHEVKLPLYALIILGIMSIVLLILAINCLSKKIGKYNETKDKTKTQTKKKEFNDKLYEEIYNKLKKDITKDLSSSKKKISRKKK
ncbi:MAG: hypothetical protein V1824_00960, partial [archaeon]